MSPLLLVPLWECAWWLRRQFRRSNAYRDALAHARRIGRPLVVVGAPDSGPTSGYGCGDVTVDIAASSCPRAVRADITKRIPLPNDSAVVFVSCVLEYVGDVESAKREILRVAGDRSRVHHVNVEPWTLTAYLYPGARRTVENFP